MKPCKFCQHPDTHVVIKAESHIDPLSDYVHKGPLIICGCCDMVLMTAEYAAFVKDLPENPSPTWLQELEFIKECERILNLPSSWFISGG